MKYLVKLSLSLLLFISIGKTIQAQGKEVVSDTISVMGICGMCEERIENAALIKGVKKVEWSSETETLVVLYRPDKVSIEEIAWELAEVGHDNEYYTCTDEQYDKVHTCCKYREQHEH
jgi:copper chaperone CopZ